MRTHVVSCVFLVSYFYLSTTSAFAHAVYPPLPVKHVFTPLAKIVQAKVSSFSSAKYAHANVTSAGRSAILDLRGTASLISQRIAARSAVSTAEVSTGARRFSTPPGSTILKQVLLRRLKNQIVAEAQHLEQISNAIKQNAVQLASLQAMALSGESQKAAAQAQVLAAQQQELSSELQQTEQILNELRQSAASVSQSLSQGVSSTRV